MRMPVRTRLREIVQDPASLLPSLRISSVVAAAYHFPMRQRGVISGLGSLSGFPIPVNGRATECLYCIMTEYTFSYNALGGAVRWGEAGTISLRLRFVTGGIRSDAHDLAAWLVALAACPCMEMSSIVKAAATELVR